jgi:hypothetical protein
MRYVLHVVGDLHQPLHSAQMFNITYPNGDAGGNFEKVTDVNGSVLNFHAFLDSGAETF